jgi:hypothetical protein
VLHQNDGRSEESQSASDQRSTGDLPKLDDSGVTITQGVTGRIKKKCENVK